MAAQFIVIHGISRKEYVSKKTGKPYEKTSIKYRGTWYSAFSDPIMKDWQEGMEVEVDLWFEKSERDGKEYGYFVPIIRKPRQRVEQFAQEQNQVEEKQEVMQDAEELQESKTELTPDDLPF